MTETLEVIEYLLLAGFDHTFHLQLNFICWHVGKQNSGHVPASPRAPSPQFLARLDHACR